MAREIQAEIHGWSFQVFELRIDHFYCFFVLELFELIKEQVEKKWIKKGKKLRNPGIEPGPPPWKGGILTIRPITPCN